MAGFMLFVPILGISRDRGETIIVLLGLDLVLNLENWDLKFV